MNFLAGIPCIDGRGPLRQARVRRDEISRDTLALPSKKWLSAG